MPTSSSRGSLRGKLVAGGALGLLVLGMWLGSFFKGFGLGGPGSGPGGGTTGNAIPETAGADDRPTNASVAIDPDTTLATASPRGTPTEPGQSSADAPPETISVMIYEGGYRLPKAKIGDDSSTSSMELKSSDFQPASLEEVVAWARAAKGNADGIRVIVLLHQSSTAGARMSLYQALASAGLQDGEIHQRTGFFQ